MRPLLDLLLSSYKPREAVLFLGPGAICICRMQRLACADDNRKRQIYTIGAFEILFLFFMNF
jgi:hypothetical protein